MKLRNTFQAGLVLAFLFHSTYVFSGGAKPPKPPSGSFSISRYPYLQMIGPHQVTVRWRTNENVTGKILYGENAAQLEHSDIGRKTTEHEILLQGLKPNTKYFYKITSVEGPNLIEDGEQFFVTAPGTTQATRVWVLGDAGTANENQKKVRDAYYQFEKAQGSKTDLILMLGDNAYNVGTDAEYQKAVFDIYTSIFKRVPVFSTRGNHEAARGSNGQAVYYDLFTFPKAAELGGIPSGTEAYYSFEYSNIHFICLDSEGSSRAKDGAMAKWLKTDLQNRRMPWTIVFWHHPPYTKGSHDSDTELELKEMRENILPILESQGVDLVLTGHSHSYERSYFMKGHYEKSEKFSAANIVQKGFGRKDKDGPYAKEMTQNEGAVYTVAGSSGKISGGSLNHKAMLVSLNRLGSVVLDVNQNQLDFKFLRENGAVDDYFTIEKKSPSKP